LAGALVVAIAFCGCANKSKTKSQLRAAFIAGERQGMVRAQQPGGPRVTIVGEVRNPVLVWSEDLTVAKAIVDAEYYGLHDPVSIVINRAGKEIRINPKRLLAGEDFELQPGDVLEIRQ
jgi:protein involved in polysaccharide export with SLBB domain